MPTPRLLSTAPVHHHPSDMVTLSAHNKTLLKPYARRYGRIRPGPKQVERRGKTWIAACKMMGDRFVNTGRMKRFAEYEEGAAELAELTYRYLDNHRDHDQEHRYHRRFKVHPNVTRRVTRSQTAIKEDEGDMDEEGDANEMEGDADEDVEVDVVGLDEEEIGTAEGEEMEGEQGSQATEPSMSPETSESARKSAQGPLKLEVELCVSKARYSRMVKEWAVNKHGRARMRTGR
ncbi:hypothetical protein RhiJN_20856 [Ceratobasidium sp. AG-Ba]|nr:hypothetical protein RhiJN_20856 [Ceratobasidium sp. AG-Ba]